MLVVVKRIMVLKCTNIYSKITKQIPFENATQFSESVFIVIRMAKVKKIRRENGRPVEQRTLRYFF